MKICRELISFLLLLCCAGTAFTKLRQKASLPEKIIVGYANWNQCNEKIIQSAQNGVNVIIWFSIDLLHNEDTGKPYINRGPDPDCVANVTARLKEMKLDTVHLISIGGWNSPHPDTRNTPEESFNEFKRWNDEVVARPELGFYGYDGIDWDIEGTDDTCDDRNYFTVETLDFMGVFSQLAQKNEFIVSMAPAESYLDPTTSAFDRVLTHVYPEWEPIVPNFNYHGHNPYSYLLSKYDVVPGSPPTFDFVTVQLYEGYSHALYNTTEGKQPASEYIKNIVQQFNKGWTVNFSTDTAVAWPTGTVKMKTSRLVVGLANGWADNTKFLLIPSSELCLGYKSLKELGQEPRGFAFWNMEDEGHTIPDGTELWLAKDLEAILHVRNPNSTIDLC